MGSTLGPIMAGIFVGFHEVDSFSKYNPIYPTPPLGQDMTQGQFLSGF